MLRDILRISPPNLSCSDHWFRSDAFVLIASERTASKNIKQVKKKKVSQWEHSKMHSQCQQLIDQLVKPSARHLYTNKHIFVFLFVCRCLRHLPINSVSSDYLAGMLSPADSSLPLLYITYPRLTYFEIKGEKKETVLLGKTILEYISFSSWSSLCTKILPPSLPTRCLACGYVRGGNFEFFLQAPEEIILILLCVIWKWFQTDFHIVTCNVNHLPNPNEV